MEGKRVVTFVMILTVQLEKRESCDLTKQILLFNLNKVSPIAVPRKGIWIALLVLS